uniref:Uncharacterized protein n=1 Tax=Naja naja TaxID=35670 RepID=A0A8C6XF74_NAJNA
SRLSSLSFVTRTLDLDIFPNPHFLDFHSMMLSRCAGLQLPSSSISFCIWSTLNWRKLYYKQCNWDTYIHTYIHAYIHTYIHTYLHTYIYTHIHTHVLWPRLLSLNRQLGVPTLQTLYVTKCGISQGFRLCCGACFGLWTLGINHPF